MEPEAGRKGNGDRILPDPYKFGPGDPYWDDMILPADFRQHVEHSIFVPMEKFGKPDHKGIIIFGPPGTGKTTVVKSIANQLGWRFYYIGPDSLGREGASPEAAMKQCIEEIRASVIGAEESDRAKMVFFFDEIEELVVSREGGADRQARLATTMMLPIMQELADLAKEHGFLYFIATNHIERFDSAITRPGRVDLVLPLGPPDRPARTYLFGKFISETSKMMEERYNTGVELWRRSVLDPRDLTVAADNISTLGVMSEGLTVGDIESVCDKTARYHIARFPEILENRDRKSVAHLSIRTFAEWIRRHQSVRNTRDAEKFEEDRKKYSRGSALYSEQHSIEEKVEREFRSLHVWHTLFSAGNVWKLGTGRQIKFAFMNLSAHSVFRGTMKISLSMGGRHMVSTEGRGEERVLPGTASGTIVLEFTPSEEGSLDVAFEISGVFFLRGAGMALRGGKAKLTGTTVIRRRITVA